ncbi:uncharacterized protein L203_105316 [Cryptococcus depauperatus CBS 7841]|uniref:Uncharacterized protein n=1 Tax=Cryptococcus depauperatus CBS 7841 TaxID=1295531 RepID=A0A1E3HLJ6_9TREE|nr:hypothetical protein L203_06312 [Cryptococcus depauperatus CBS 7841]
MSDFGGDTSSNIARLQLLDDDLSITSPDYTGPERSSKSFKFASDLYKTFRSTLGDGEHLFNKEPIVGSLNAILETENPPQDIIYTARQQTDQLRTKLHYTAEHDDSWAKSDEILSVMASTLEVAESALTDEPAKPLPEDRVETSKKGGNELSGCQE